MQGVDVPADWLRATREGGVFGVIGRLSVRDGARRTTVLGRAHPGAAWLEWTAKPVTRTAGSSAAHPTAPPSIDSRAGPG